MQTIPLFPLSTYPAGTYNSPAAGSAVPVGTTSVELLIDVTTQPDPIPAFDVSEERSMDGGVTWTQGVSAHRDASPKGFQRGGVIPATTFGFTDAAFPDPTNPNRRIRGKAIISGPCAMSGSIILRP